MTVVVGGDEAALDLFALLDDAHLVLPEAPAYDVDGEDVVEAKALRVGMAAHRTAGLVLHRDGEELRTLPGPVVLAGREPTRIWTGEGGLGHGLALGLLAGADATGMADLTESGPTGGLEVDDDGRTDVSGLYALGGAVGEVGPGLKEVAGAVAHDRTPSRVPIEARPEIDRPMPDGFAGPKLERLSDLVADLDPSTSDDDLAEAERQVRGLYGEMRSYLQARRSEELLDLRDAVVVAMAVVEALQDA